MRKACGTNGRIENYQLLPMVRSMSLTLDQIVEEAQQWPDDVVADLVDRLMLARHGVKNPALNAAWRSTVDRRVEEIRSGKEKGIPGEVVSARIRKIVGR
jgi:putative addiction module component (TIGR02574 family)